MADESLGDRTSLSPDQIVSLLNLCLGATFRGKCYQQVFGTAMGSPVSVTVANLVMEDVEQRALSSFPSPPSFWKRYVYDVFTVLVSQCVQQFLDHLNRVEPSIQFTCEMEKDGSLPFLDVEVMRTVDGSLSTKVYRKRTHMDKYVLGLCLSPSAKTEVCLGTYTPFTGTENRDCVGVLPTYLRRNSMLPQRWNGMAIHDLLSSGSALGSLHVILLWIALSLILQPRW